MCASNPVWDFIPNRGRLVKPLGSPTAYFDVVGGWLRRPASKATLAELRKHCARLYTRIGPDPWGGDYKQRFELKQPDEEAIRLIAEIRGVLTNKIEIALDYAFASEADRDAFYDYLSWHVVRRWHGMRQEVCFIDRTRYDGGRYARNRIVMYPQPASRITGESHVVHFEWRLVGVRAANAVGIKSAEDLIGFDHKSFWQRHLVLLDLTEVARLGRYMRNRASGGKGRASHPDDRRIGITMLHASGAPMLTGTKDRETNNRREVTLVHTVQGIINQYGWARIQRVLTRLPNDHLLPDSNSHRGPNYSLLPVITT